MSRAQPTIETELGESVVDEIRAIREELDSEANHDIRQLAENARLAGETVRRQYGMSIAQLPAALPPFPHEVTAAFICRGC